MKNPSISQWLKTLVGIIENRLISLCCTKWFCLSVVSAIIMAVVYLKHLFTEYVVARGARLLKRTVDGDNELKAKEDSLKAEADALVQEAESLEPKKVTVDWYKK